MLTSRQGMSSNVIEQLIAQCIVDAIMDYKATRNYGNEAIMSCGLSKTVEIDAAYEMFWKELMKMMTELALLHLGMVLDKEKKIKRYIWGLLDKIQGNVTSSKPLSCQNAIRMANNFMDQKVCAGSARQAKNKRRWESNQGNNHVQQPPPKRQNVATAYTAGSNKKGGYVGKAPFYNKSQRIADAITDYEATQNNGNEGHNKASGGAGGVVHTAQGCSYKEFLNCQPHKFGGTKGVVGLASALTWWNSHVKTIEIDAAYEMSWKELMKMMTEGFAIALAVLITRVSQSRQHDQESIVHFTFSDQRLEQTATFSIPTNSK
nr:hypothetical protein [Tanacetum cinerariifolium]